MSKGCSTGQHEHTSSSKKRVGEAATARLLFSDAGLSDEVAEPERGV